MRFSILLFLMLQIVGIAARGADDLVTTIKRNGEFTLFLRAVQTVGLTPTLDHGGSYTIFAPTDAAFAKVPPGIVEGLFKPENKQKLTSIVEAHFLRGKLTSADIKTTAVITYGKAPINTTHEGSEMTYGGAKIIKRDIIASNGIIHSIDRIVLPSQEETAPPSPSPGSKKIRRTGKTA